MRHEARATVSRYGQQWPRWKASLADLPSKQAAFAENGGGIRTLVSGKPPETVFETATLWLYQAK
jgi:hypothetical protein